MIFQTGFIVEVSAGVGLGFFFGFLVRYLLYRQLEGSGCIAVKRVMFSL